MNSHSNFSLAAVLAFVAVVSALRGQSAEATDYARATRLLGQRVPDEAIPILESIVKRAPGYYRAYSALAEAYLQKHATDSGTAYFAGLLRDPDRSAFANLGMGQIALGKADWGKALEYFAACVRQRPNSTPCYIPLADSLGVMTRNSATAANLASRIPENRTSPRSCLAFTRQLLSQRKLSDALRSAQSCLARAEGANELDFLMAANDLMADAYGGSGNQYENELHYHLESARLAAQLDDPVDAAHHDLNVCLDYGFLDRYREAQECFARISALARAEGNRSVLIHLLFGSSVLKKRMGELDQTILDLSERSDLLQRDGDFEGATGSLLEIGNVNLLKGDLQASRRSYEEALAVAREHSYRPIQAYVLRELSKVYSLLGDPIVALRYANQSIAIFRELDMRWQAGAGVGNLPEIYAFMGDWGSALRYARESLQSATEFEDELERQDTLATLGNVLLGAGRHREAVDAFLESLSLGRSTRFAPFHLTALMGLGSAYLTLKEYGHAERRLLEALQLARQLGNVRAEANALAGLGRCYRQLGSLQKAGAYFNQALKLAAPIPVVEATLAAQRGLGELAIRGGDFKAALANLESAARDIESIRSRIPTADLKTDFGTENAKLYEDLVYVLAQMDRREPGRGWDRKAFEYAERGRARAFLDLLSESRAQITKGLSAEQRQQRTGLEAELSRSIKALMEHDTEVNRRAARKAETALGDWITSIRITNPSYQGLIYPQPIGAAEAVKRAGRMRLTALEYTLGDRESYLWVVTQGQIRLFRLPGRASIGLAVNEYRKVCAQHPRGEQFDAWQDKAAALYNVLVKPAEQYLAPDHPLVIAPDGILHYLPFETLRASGPNDGAHCLIEQFPISYVPSVSVLAELEDRSPGRARKMDLLAYGDPLFSRRGETVPLSAELVRGIYEATGIHFPQLPNTRREVDGIGRLFAPERRTTLLGLNATESSVKHANLLDYRLVHFATHAVIDDRNPARSGIVLSLVNTGDEDGILRMNEILNLEMSADLVVLSACQTGLGSLVRAEGMVGLTRAFLYAGARGVAVSLWDVNDLIAPEFMESLYRHLKQGRAPAEALRSAKLEMLHSGSPVRANPYFWAPFILVASPN